jgi:general stress protein 26
MKSTADPSELLARFWRELADIRTGMLALSTDGDGHAQPMTAHFEGTRGPIWFFARRDSHLAEGAERPHAAAFHYVDGGHDLYACVHGELQAVDDPAAVDRFWSEEVARWFEGGKKDSNLALLRFTPDRAHIWLPRNSHEANTFGFDRDAPRDVRAEARI